MKFRTFAYLILFAGALFGLWALLDTEDAEVAFSFEFFRKATAPSTEPLPAGTILKLQSTNLKANETLLLYRCGEPCNTAKQIKGWKSNDFAGSAKQTVECLIREGGQYYLWISKKTENNEYGPVLGDHDKTEGNTSTLIFSSGTIVEVTLKFGGGPR